MISSLFNQRQPNRAIGDSVQERQTVFWLPTFVSFEKNSVSWKLRILLIRFNKTIDSKFVRQLLYRGRSLGKLPGPQQDLAWMAVSNKYHRRTSKTAQLPGDVQLSRENPRLNHFVDLTHVILKYYLAE